MLRPQLHQKSSVNSILPYKKPFLHGNGHGFNAVQLRPPATHRRQRGTIRAGLFSDSIKTILGSNTDENTISVKAIVTEQKTVGTLVSVSTGFDTITDFLGRTLQLELVSIELDPKTGAEKEPIRSHASFTFDGKIDGIVQYEASFDVPADYGEIGAVLVQNKHGSEMFLRDIVLEGLPTGTVTIPCNSFVQSRFTQKRVFFTPKSFLPSKTPEGLKTLRDLELENLRGNGKGQRDKSDRIYDYDVYNDLGDPDRDSDLARPVLGGKEHPYPRRCRTGRPKTRKDPSSEQKTLLNYVPRDENFSDIKQVQFGAKTVYSALHAVIPTIESTLIDKEMGFPYFTEIEKLYNEGINVSLPDTGFLRTAIPRLIKTTKDTSRQVVRFETPDTLERDRFLWLRDEEFGRQTLAGLNPLSIKLITAGLALGDLKSVKDLYDFKTLSVLFLIGALIILPTLLKRKRVYE